MKLEPGNNKCVYSSVKNKEKTTTKAATAAVPATATTKKKKCTQHYVVKIEILMKLFDKSLLLLCLMLSGRLFACPTIAILIH